jgi:hypothetical protein
MAALSGSTAGILGLPTLYGFAFYVVSVVGKGLEDENMLRTGTCISGYLKLTPLLNISRTFFTSSIGPSKDIVSLQLSGS